MFSDLDYYIVFASFYFLTVMLVVRYTFDIIVSYYFIFSLFCWKFGVPEIYMLAYFEYVAIFVDFDLSVIIIVDDFIEGIVFYDSSFLVCCRK